MAALTSPPTPASRYCCCCPHYRWCSTNCSPVEGHPRSESPGHLVLLLRPLMRCPGSRKSKLSRREKRGIWYRARRWCCNSVSIRHSVADPRLSSPSVQGGPALSAESLKRGWDHREAFVTRGVQKARCDDKIPSVWLARLLATVVDRNCLAHAFVAMETLDRRSHSVPLLVLALREPR